MSVDVWQTLRIVEPEADIRKNYRHLSSSPAVTIATVVVQDPIQRLSNTMVTLCPSVATSRKHSPSSIPLRRQWYLRRLSTSSQCTQLLDIYSTTTHQLRWFSQNFTEAKRLRQLLPSWHLAQNELTVFGCSVGWNCT